MLRIASKQEITDRDARLRLLYTSDYVIDVITAALYDSRTSIGLSERDARQKAAKILDHLGICQLARVNRDLTPGGSDKAAIAKGVLGNFSKDSDNTAALIPANWRGRL